MTGGDLFDSLDSNSPASAKLGDRLLFERVGYFCVDPDLTAGKLVFNRTFPLKDAWAKIEKKAGA